MRIAVTAPSRSLGREVPGLVKPIAEAEGAEVVFHPQCFLSEGHFAGPDEARADAFLEAANDPGFDAVWFARGGYGANRVVEAVMARLGEPARGKLFLGYSDGGTLLAGLDRAGFRAAHGPLPDDVRRDRGPAAVARALRWLLKGDPESLEPSLMDGHPAVAFNLTILSHLLGTAWEPEVRGRVLMVEEVSEPVYRIDRALGQVVRWARAQGALGLRLGRCSCILPNDPEFGRGPEEVAREWCALTGLPWLGPADIGHDADNKVVPFGRP